MKTSQRIQSVRESSTTRLTPAIDRLRREGKRVINLAVGEPEFATPAAVVSATTAALRAGKTRYGAVAGEAELRRALAREFPGWGPENIVVANGAKQALFQLFQVLCDPGDEVIIPRPNWVSFPQQVRLAGARPVFVDCRDHLPDPTAIASAATKKTRAVVLNSPNNPTGAVYPEKIVRAIARICIEKDLVLISDEAYEAFVYDGVSFFSPFAAATVRDRLAVVRSFSKTSAMTGFRVGWVAAPAPLAREMIKLQSHATGNVCAFAQYGALAALEMDNSTLAARRFHLERKRDFAYKRISPLFPCVRPQGAFYLFPDISSRLNGKSSADFAAELLQNAHVAVVPGEAFGAPGHIRISYAVSEQDLTEALDRLERML